MAMWYECGNGFVRASFARCSLGNDVYLCCPGPSLANVKDVDLHIPGATVVVLNTAYPRIRPDIWIGMDVPLCYSSKLWWEPFIKICRGSYQEERCLGYPVRHCYNVFFADCGPGTVAEIFKNRAHDVRFFWNGNTFTTALSILVWMGAQKIHLVGCDFGGKSDYYDDRKLSDQERSLNRNLYNQQTAFLRDFNRYAQVNNLKLVSCTLGSPVNEFLDYVPLVDALKRTSERVPNVDLSPIHSVTAEYCDWGKVIDSELGVMVGCAPMHEDIIPWWIKNYSTFNKLPLVFADFGISKKAKELCGVYGKVIDMTDIPVDGWFRKPFAILRAPFKKIIWSDLDIEIKGSLRSLFNYVNDGYKLAAGWDSYEPQQFRKFMPQDAKLWDSGLLVISHGNPVITLWAGKILSAPKDYYVGDHEVLSLTLAETKQLFYQIPKTVHRMRTEGPVPGLVTFHWTGNRGKKHIRSILMARIGEKND